jgi:hypothetical protein
MGCIKKKQTPTLILLSGETWFQLIRYTKSQNIMLIHEMPLHDIKAGAWYAMSVLELMYLFFSETVYTH